MANSFCHPYMQSITEETSNFDIDTDCFTRHDLMLFVESLEIIARLERQKHERQHRRKERKQRKWPMMDLVAQMHRIKASSELCAPQCFTQEIDSDCTISAPSGDEAENEQIITLEAKQLPNRKSNTPIKQNNPSQGGKLSPTRSSETDFDENYFSAPNSQQNSPRSSVQIPDTHKNTHPHKNSNSDSEESGVFAAHTEQIDDNDVVYPKVVPLRPRSVVITKPKSSTMRSRIIGLVLKREHLQEPASHSEHKQAKKQLRADRKHAKAAKRRDERRDRLIDNLLKQSMSSMATKSNVRRGVAIEDGSVEERFLNKALRYLTL